MLKFTPQQAKLRRYFWRVGEVGLLFFTVALLVFIFALVFRYIMPFVIGWFIAVLLLPIVRSLERHGVGRVLAVISVMGTVLVCLLFIFVYAVASIIREASLLSLNAGQYFTVIDGWAQQQIAISQDFFGTLPKRVGVELQNTVSGMLTSVQSLFQGLLKTMIHSVTHLPESLFVMVIAIITAFLLLVRREQMYHQFLKVLPPGWSSKIQMVVRDVARAFVGTIRVQLLLMLLSSVLGTIGMLVIGVPYAVLLGVLFGISGMVPILGSALLTVPWAIGAFALGDFPLAIKVLLLQVIISIIRHMVEPKILADNVGLGILSTLFGLYVGMRVLGFIGLFLGPIIVIGIKSLLRAHMFRDFLPVEDPPETTP